VAFASSQYYTARIVSDTQRLPQTREEFEGPGMFHRWRCLNLRLRTTRNTAARKAKSAYAVNFKRRTSMFKRLSYPTHVLSRPIYCPCRAGGVTRTEDAILTNS
jgi:hypothetical protein